MNRQQNPATWAKRNPIMISKIDPSTWRFRQLGEADREQIESHLLRLDCSDRFRRFCAVVTDDSIASLLSNLDWRRSLLVGCFVDNVLRGLIHMCDWPDGNREAELAISVDKVFRRSGMATALMQSAMRLSAENGFKAVAMITQPDNTPIRGFAVKLGFSMTDTDNQTFARLAWNDAAQESIYPPDDVVHRFG
jgi:ribosomal protein S18 acetylase RimI-like enzyme